MIVPLIDGLVVDVERRAPEPERDVRSFWSFLKDAPTPHVVPATAVVAPDTGAAIAMIRALLAEAS